jgi:hypothetical protein
LLIWAIFFIAVAVGFTIIFVESTPARIFFALDGLVLLASTLLWVHWLDKVGLRK